MKKLFRINERLRSQPWYTEDVYELVKIYEERVMLHFGTDCKWRSIETGLEMHRWNREFEPLPIEESIKINRDLKLNELID